MNSTFPETRSQGERKASVTTLYRTIKSQDSMAVTRSGSDEEFIPIHVVNYSDKDGGDAGFVVMTDDERVEDPYFVYNNEGNWSADSFSNFGVIFFDLLDGYLQRSIAEYEATEQFQTRVNPPRCNKIVELVSDNSSSHECRIGLKWKQVPSPYSMLTERCQYCGGAGIAGCVPIAMAQVMAYHQKPSYATCNRLTSYQTMTYNWTQMKANPDATLLGSPYNTQVAHILAVCGEKAGVLYGCMAHGTSGNLSSAKTAFENLGYNNVIYTSSYNTSVIKSSLDANRPVIMGGSKQNGTGGHAWVVEGYSYVNEHWVKGEECNGVRNVYDQYKQTFRFYFTLGQSNTDFSDRNNDGYYSGSLFDFTSTNLETKFGIHTLSGMY